MGDDLAADLLARIDDTTAAVSRRPLSWEELERLRAASRKLRRAIEVRSISTSAVCRGCDHMFVPQTSGDAFCSDGCRSAAAGSAGSP